jgi:hypothetical protein
MADRRGRPRITGALTKWHLTPSSYKALRDGRGGRAAGDCDKARRGGREGGPGGTLRSGKRLPVRPRLVDHSLQVLARAASHCLVERFEVLHGLGGCDRVQLVHPAVEKMQIVKRIDGAPVVPSSRIEHERKNLARGERPRVRFKGFARLARCLGHAVPSLRPPPRGGNVGRHGVGGRGAVRLARSGGGPMLGGRVSLAISAKVVVVAVVTSVIWLTSCLAANPRRHCRIALQGSTERTPCTSPVLPPR